MTLVPSSKKEAAVRRRELLAYLREPLREACASNAGELMRSKFAGALVLLEAVRVRAVPALFLLRGRGALLLLPSARHAAWEREPAPGLLLSFFRVVVVWMVASALSHPHKYLPVYCC